MQMRAFLLVIQIQEVFRLQQSAGKLRRPSQPGFLIDGEDEFQRTMSNVVALHNRQGS